MSDQTDNIKSLEYWLFKSIPTKLAYHQEITKLLVSLKETTLYSEEYTNCLEDIQIVYQKNRLLYEHIGRRQIEKAIQKMKSTVIDRVISTTLAPVVNKVADSVVPVVKKTWANQVLPATDKTLRFLTKHFVKKKTVVEETKE